MTKSFKFVQNYDFLNEFWFQNDLIIHREALESVNYKILVDILWKILKRSNLKKKLQIYNKIWFLYTIEKNYQRVSFFSYCRLYKNGVKVISKFI